ncbi:Hypothetical protein SRAE_X000087400 [Strongyloides ratti]|uniref:Uncharacterized protein n=1 Tax=Strongyloides ratti TaxID=34506 RepID=A0A090LNV7_STRRB|nr:Hypothetical protein SRAE_X000087400 [Strongyloides ratti]CEF71550.1 Hypothetical protein SRAE_X000087400 [Strongyloides ratti]
MFSNFYITIKLLIILIFLKFIQSDYQYDYDMGLIPAAKISAWVPIVVGLNVTIIIFTFCCLISLVVNYLCKIRRRYKNNNEEELNEIVSMSIINLSSVV